MAGLGTYLPERIRTSEEIEASLTEAGFTVPRGYIEQKTGVRERRVAGATENASDLAVISARGALAEAGRDPLEVDLLIFASASQDVFEPATANIVQTKIGAARAETYDLKNACNSVMSALDVAQAYLKSGMARVVLIVTGEMPSRAIDLSFASEHDLRERFAHLTMGDAGAAMVVTPAENPGDGMLATAGVTRGDQWQLSTIMSGGTMYPRDLTSHRAYLQTKGRELEALARDVVPPLVGEVLKAVAWDTDSVDLVVTQQHSERIITEVVELAGICASRVVNTLPYAGNAASANIPLALAEARRRGHLERGSRVLLLGGSSGFSAVVTAMRW